MGRNPSIRFVLGIAITAIVAGPALGDVIVENDLVYKHVDGLDLKLDLARPAKLDEPAPAVICIHGGAWRMGNKAEFRPHILKLASLGYVAVAVQYRLAPDYAWPAQIEDVKCAVRYLRAHAEELHIDTNRIAALGGSAGAHLALLLGLTDDNVFNDEGAETDQSARVQVVFNYSGPTDLSTWRVAKGIEEEFLDYNGADSDGVLSDLLGTSDRSSSLMAEASPIHYVDKDDSPVYTFHGSADAVVMVDQAKELHEALDDAGVRNQLVILDGAGHAFTPLELANSTLQTVVLLGTTFGTDVQQSLAAIATPQRLTVHDRVEMKDGTKLATDSHFASIDGGPWPVILIRSTYGRAIGPTEKFLEEGFAVVVQDVRGMGRSDGQKYVFRADGWREGQADGADTVAWIRKQPWCNGKIGTWGGSALGITELLLAPTTVDVSAQHVELAPANLFEGMFYQGGVFRKQLVETWLPMIGQGELLREYRQHPTYDNFWGYYDVEARASDITAPAVFLGGWFDIFLQGTLDAFVSRERDGGAGARGHNYLIMRPSCHEEKTSDDYALNENRWSLDVNEIMTAFYRYHLKDDKDALAGIPKVHYYVMGADTAGAPGNAWRTAEAWPPFETTETPYCLQEDGSLSTDSPARSESSVRFTFDPADPFPTHGGANLFLPAGPRDQRSISKGRKDLLRFSTAPLGEPLEVTGRIKVRLFASSDAPDTDFTAKLLDIYPEEDGREILVVDGIRRVKTRLGYDSVAPPLKGIDEVVELEIDLQSTSWIFDIGHRIGLHISSSNYPRFEVNPNTGADFPEDGAKMRTATNSVHMGGDYPSALILPLRPRTVENGK